MPCALVKEVGGLTRECITSSFTIPNPSSLGVPNDMADPVDEQYYVK